MTGLIKSLMMQFKMAEHNFHKLIGEKIYDETLPIPFHFIGSFLSVSWVDLMPLRHRLLEDSQNINFSRFAVG